MNDRADERSTQPRRAPRLALPPYRYVPGRTPHPLRHPGGHLQRPESPRPISHDEALAYALDLFAARYYWEAHEVWEGLWHTATGHDRAVLQSLIQLAAGYLKLELGSPRLARTLFVAARERLALVPDQLILGLDLAPIRVNLEYAVRGEAHDPTHWLP